MVIRLEARSVTKTYRERCVLAAVDVRVEAGDVLAVLGSSGSGKTTLARICQGLERPEDGRVDIDGVPLPAYPGGRTALARRIGYVQQRPGLLRAKVLENAAFPMVARGVSREEARRVASEWLSRFGLGELAGDEAATLSGGEAQRLALARAFAPRPELLILDEPTNQLDPQWTRAAENALSEARSRGAAVLLITHSQQQARRVANRVLFLEHGRVAEEGPVGILERPRGEGLKAFLDAS